MDEEVRLQLLSRLLDFGHRSLVPTGGFGWLDERGEVTPGRERLLYVTCRMTHVYALASLLGRRGADRFVEHGVRSLDGVLRDREHGGWVASIGVATDEPVDSSKGAYGHAFVVLAAASAAAAGSAIGERLLEESLSVMRDRFWDDEQGMVVDSWDPSFSEPDGYRGLNAAMHATEALLAASDATGDDTWAAMADRMVERVVRLAQEHCWRLPEHFDARWRPLLEANASRPADPFKPYGATPGHAVEWSRLVLGAAHRRGGDASLVEAARALFDTAMADSWFADGVPGMVYTTDWQGRPIVRQRLHWPVSEAVCTASALTNWTHDTVYDAWTSRLWRYLRGHVIDHGNGSWRYELGPDLGPSAVIRDGRPDLYHAAQACLFESLPRTASVLEGVRTWAAVRQVLSS